MSKIKTWMPLYIGDYLADTASLSTLQHGAYMLLMMEMWRNGPIPNNPRRLSRVAKTDVQTWEDEIWPDLQDFFTVVDGFLDQKRLRAEREKAEEVSKKRADAAAKRHSAKQTTCKPDANADQTESVSYANAEQMQSKCRANGCANDIQNACKVEGTRAVCASALQSQSQSHNNPSLRSGRSAPISIPDQPVDARTMLFAEGRATLSHMTGKPAGQCGALIGRWLKACGDQCDLLLSVIRDAADHRPAEAVPWIERAIQSRISTSPASLTRTERVAAAWANVPDFPGV